jgi:CheY-like chemotaxis protein
MAPKIGAGTMAVILIVEDEDQVRVLAQSFLQAEGNQTLSAATVEQALALIEGEEPVDLLFVDLKIQDDVEGGLRLAQKAVVARPNFEGALHVGPSLNRWHGCAICRKIRLFAEALYGRAACHHTSCKIQHRQPLNVRFLNQRAKGSPLSRASNWHSK